MALSRLMVSSDLQPSNIDAGRVRDLVDPLMSVTLASDTQFLNCPAWPRVVAPDMSTSSKSLKPLDMSMVNLVTVGMISFFSFVAECDPAAMNVADGSSAMVP